MRAALFSDRGLMVHLNGGGWLSEMSVGSGEKKETVKGENY